MKVRWIMLLLVVAALACTPSTRLPAISPASVVLVGSDGAPHPLDAELRAHAFTVVSFFSAHCPCQAAHDPRLRALIAADGARGVGFVIVDSEESATSAETASESLARGYPILLDRDGALARAASAEYATYSMILDPTGRVVYRGGFDSDRSHLREDRTPFLALTLDDLLAGRKPRWRETKALGCALQLH